MKIYSHEIKDGLAELVQSQSSVAYAMPAVLKNKNELTEESIKHIITDSVLKTKADKANPDQIDLYYISSVLVSTGWNKNDDVFEASSTWAARNTPEDKQFNFMHNENDIIGHITGSYVTDRKGNIVSDDTQPDDFDIITEAVLYNSWTEPENRQRMQQLIAEIEEATGQDLMDADIATLLLAGIITDTGSFQHSNTTPNAFAVAAELLDYGARQQEIIKHVYKTKSLATLKLWGQVLSKIQFDKDYRFVWSTVSQKDLAETGADMEDTGAIIDELLNNAPGAEVVALIKEKVPGELVSVSLRTTTDEVDASALARLFDGGGHVRAAGCRIKGMSFNETIYQFVSTVLKRQAERLNLPVPELTPEKNSDAIQINHNQDGAYYNFDTFG